MSQSQWMTEHSSADAFTFLKIALAFVGVFSFGYMMLSAQAPAGPVLEHGFNFGMVGLGVVYIAVVVGFSLRRRA